MTLTDCLDLNIFQISSKETFTRMHHILAFLYTKSRNQIKVAINLIFCTVKYIQM